MNSIPIRVLFLFLLAWSLSNIDCGQKDPLLDTPFETEKTGAIAVFSDPPGATIVLDALETGLITPDTLEDISLGQHTVIVVLQGHTSCTGSRSVDVSEVRIVPVEFVLLKKSIQHVVLGEDFTSTTCDPCHASGLVLDSLADLYSGSFVLIRYHVWWPPPGDDPFFLANVDENTTRNEYYNNFFAPQLFLDGILNAGRDHSLWGALLSERIELHSQIDLTLFNSRNGSQGTVTADVVSCSDLSDRNLAIHFVLTEDEVQFQAPNGKNIFYQVMRDMLPDAGGERITLLPQVRNQVSRDYELKSGWNPSRMNMVVFIQDNGTKEVLQSASISIQ